MKCLILEIYWVGGLHLMFLAQMDRLERWVQRSCNFAERNVVLCHGYEVGLNLRILQDHARLGHQLDLMNQSIGDYGTP